MIDEAVQGIVHNSFVGIPINECDYKKDGLYYCGKCHTPKQGRFYLGDREIKPLLQCKCMQEEEQRAEEEQKAQKKQEIINNLRFNGIQDNRLLDCSFDVDETPNTKRSQAFRRYVAKWAEIQEKNIGLLFFGGVGTGKSFYGGCIANEIIRTYTCPVIVTSIPKILNQLFNTTDKNEYIMKLANIPLLMIDDLGAERETEYALEQIYAVIDERYKAKKPLIVTTNLTLEQLKNPEDIVHKRIYDRIIEVCVPFNFEGNSRRDQKAAERTQTAKSLLFDDDF